MVFNTIGWIHLISAIIALITGSMVLFKTKGTVIHKQIGWLYVVSMAIMLITSFMIYRLFNGFGLFHVFSIASSITLAGGIVPAIRRRSANWIDYHFAFMYWSVIGLYAAFVAEAITRIPSTPFFGMLGIAISIVMGLGTYYWVRYKKLWTQQFSATKQP